MTTLRTRVAAATTLVLCCSLAWRCGTPTTAPSGNTQNQTPAVTRILSVSGDLAFGNVIIGTTATRTFTMTNTGNSTLTFTSIKASGGTLTSGLAASPISGTVSAGGSVTVTLFFTPTLVQAYSVGVIITSDITSGNSGISMTGAGVLSAPASFGDGQYLIGTALAAGVYFTAPPANCYFERESGTGGTSAEILGNFFPGTGITQWIVEIKSTDKAFKTTGCGTWDANPRSGAKSTITPGLWIVGNQISSGTWTASAAVNCYWERTSDFGNAISSIVANNFLQTAASQTVTIAVSDVGFDSSAQCGTWTKVSGVEPVAETPSATSPGEIEANRQQAVRGRGGAFR